MSDDWEPTTGLLAQVGRDQGGARPIPGYTNDDIALVTRLIFGEAGDQDDDAMAGVAWNVVNRVRAPRGEGFPRRIRDVVFQPYNDGSGHHQYNAVDDPRWSLAEKPDSLKGRRTPIAVR